MKKIIFLLLIISANITSGFSQSADFAGVKKINLTNVNAIIQNNEVVGYYAFYVMDKSSGSENEYGLEILDNNLKVTHSIKMKQSNKSVLLEAGFNGDNFCFSFVDLKKKALEYKMYDKTGKPMPSYKVLGLNNNEISYYGQMMQNEDDNFSGWLHAVPNKGFVRCGMENEGGARVEIEMFDNAGKKKWTANSGATSKKSYESLLPLYTNDKYFITGLTTREKMLSMSFDFSAVVFDVNSGKQKFSTSSKHDKGYLWPIGASVEGEDIIIYGEYYEYDDAAKTKMDISKKIGFYTQVFDETGKLKQENFSSWDKDVAKFVPVNEKGKLDNNTSVMIHKLVKTSDGKYYAIGEQFKKNLALGAAALGASAAKISLYDMMIFEFDNNLKLQKVNIIQKEKTDVVLPRGAGVNGSATLGYFAKTMGWFDYLFTTQSSDKSTFNSVYLNYDKGVSEGSKYTIGNIALTKEKTLANPKVNLKTKPTAFIALPAKPGYIAVFEYFKKKKSASMHLEKLDI